MFGQPGGFRRRIQELVTIFREKGATSAEKAMTAQELGLPPRFQDAMKRRLGATGVFVEVNGRYYLDEARLQQFQLQRRTGAGSPMVGRWASRKNMVTLRIVRMCVGIAAIALVLANIFFLRSTDARVAVVVLVVVWIALTVFQVYYLARLRSSWGSARIPQ